MVRRSLAALGGVLTLGLGGVLGGCGSASDPSPPSGIDLLTIPTPAVDPGDFVRRIDNPWLPYAAGATWTYRVTGGSAGGVLTVAVRPDTETVAGVRASVVDRTAPDGTVTSDLFAQDRDGNVWWLGREGVWRAGEDGAEAGLAMPATPRVGDGWRAAYDADVVEDAATITDLGGNASTPAGRYDALVVIETTSPLAPGETRTTSYARGIGPVEETSGTAGSAVLVTAPSAN